VRTVLLTCVAAGAVFLLAGCKSPYVATVVSNRTGNAVTLIEVDYPSASFGRDALAAGADFPYRFKIIGSGPAKVSWTDAARHDRTSTGPALHDGQHGQLIITLTPTGATWNSQLSP